MNIKMLFKILSYAVIMKSMDLKFQLPLCLTYEKLIIYLKFVTT